MHKCGRCGGSLRRIHRSLAEHFGYMAIYRCSHCKEKQVVPRPWMYHLGPAARCPICGTQRITKLKTRDRIDPMYRGFLNLVERLTNGQLYHCRFCRVQFYDRRHVVLAQEARTARETAESAPSAQSSV
jgi:DNA-directed RNA polymerase subunit RPC12/RpoP